MELLVIGGTGGVGTAVVHHAREIGYKVVTAGLDPNEDLYVDLENAAQVVSLFRSEGPWAHVVCAAGLNLETPLMQIGLSRHSQRMAQVNYLGPIVALQAWLKTSAGGHYVAVSSNSAHIPRTTSLGYCASKAALSMAVRVAAREAAERAGYAIWGVEPGWIEDTPMSKKVWHRLGDKPAHRIPGSRTNTAHDIAAFIMDGIDNDNQKWNGCMFRLDAGEL